MISKKTFSALLTSASLATLSIMGAGRAGAATQSFGTVAAVTWATNTDWLNITPTTDVGTFTNTATISDGFPNPDADGGRDALAVHVRSGVTIDHFVNEGNISATESAFGNHPSVHWATATGLGIDGTVPLVTNNGNISALAVAAGTNFATAEAKGIEYDAQFNDTNLPSNIASVVNTKTIAATATAAATGTTSGEVGARAAGIDQWVTANGTAGTTATASVNNTGDIDAGATARVIASSQANANASATGIAQGVHNGDIGVATVTNSGNSIHVAATARAFSADSDATATAVALGITQSVTATTASGGGTSATATTTNNGTVDVLADSKAEANGNGAALSLGLGAGVTQIVGDTGSSSGDPKTAAANFTNGSGGTLTTTVKASAEVDVIGIAIAADAGVGVFQLADGNDGTDSSATATAANDGTIKTDVTADAKAEFAGFGDALAGAASGGIVQLALDAENASASARNGGHLDVSGVATAEITAGTYAAAGAVGAGIVQVVSGNGDPASTLSAITANTGTINVVGRGNVAVSSYAGLGLAVGAGIGNMQIVGLPLSGPTGAHSAAASSTNSGSLTVLGEANVTGEEFGYVIGPGNADAIAFAAGTYQVAMADGSAGSLASVAATNTNTGTIGITGRASVDIAAATYADANAFAIGRFQIADPAETATATASNAGTINVLGEGSLKADTNLLGEVGAFGVGTYQVAEANGSATSHATATASNTGTIGVTSNATADIGEVGLEISVAFAAGLLQSATDAHTAAVLFTNGGALNVAANANAKGGTGTYAVAEAAAVGVDQFGLGTGDAGSTATATLNNSGSVLVNSTATVKFTESVRFAGAFAESAGIEQDVFGAATSKASLTNAAAGAIGANAAGTATGYVAAALAAGIAVGQEADVIDGAGNVASTLTNNIGKITAVGDAKAFGTYVGEAEAAAVGVDQFASGASATVDTENSGTIDVSATATATSAGPGSIVLSGAAPAGSVGTPAAGPGFALAVATYVGGVFQSAEGERIAGAVAQAITSNTGTIKVAAVADAQAATYAIAEARDFGIQQRVDPAPSLSAIADNTDTIAVTAKATASGALVSADASAFGIGQNVDGSSAGGTSDGDGIDADSKAKITNTASISADARAAAGGLDTSRATTASARAGASGAYQDIDGSLVAAASVTNSGSISGYAEAKSKASAEAFSDAHAWGVFTGLFDSTAATATLDNQAGGKISGQALAVADSLAPATADAHAFAVGYEVEGYGTPTLTLNIANAGEITAAATATVVDPEVAGQHAHATALGISIETDGTVDGLLNNTGTISANAIVNAAAAADATANAVGIFDPSKENDAVITNSGLVYAYAQGPHAFASAIVVAADKDGIDPGQATVTNDGGQLWAGYSTDGGTTVHRGNAINTDGTPNSKAEDLMNFVPAPGPVVINLMDSNGGGAASIFGNIDITPDDLVHVTDGQTRLDGVVNPDLVLEGSLTVDSHGKLVLGNTNDVDGPSAVYVNTFTNGHTGTLALELNTKDGAGDYPTVNAVTANLDGTLAANYAKGLYGKNLRYNNVIAADVRNGKFDHVVDNSVVLKTQAIYDDNGNVDLKVTRQGFGSVGGLSKNESAVGGGIDDVYSKLPASGKFSDLVQNLLLVDSQSDYAKILDQLSGAQYAQMLGSVLGSTGEINSTITDRLDCGTNYVPGAGSSAAHGPTACFNPGHVQLWGRVTGGWNTDSGDSNAPGYSEDQYGLLFGGDYAVTDHIFLGLAGGYFSSNMNFDRFGGLDGASGDYQGGQFAAYGAWDNTVWYGRGIVSAGVYSGSMHRDFQGINPSPVDPSGSPDSSVVSFYGEGGRRFVVTPNVTATPFLGLGIAGAQLDGFTESDPNGTGAALKISDSDASSVASVLGLRVSGNWGGFKPELSVAWQHEYLDTVQTVHAAFASAPGGSGFNVLSSDPGADSFLVGVGGTYQINARNDLTVKYFGQFTSGYTANDVVARWTSKF